MLHEEREVEADEGHPEVHRAEALVQHPAGDLGEPVVDAGVEREHRSTEQHVVHVRDDEVGVGDWKSIGADASITPERPPSRNVTMNPSANFIAAGNVICPPHIVPIQLKNFTPVGTAISIDRPGEVGERDGAGGEHVVGPHADRQRCDRRAWRSTKPA